MNITHEPEETKLSLANTSSTTEIMRVDLDGGFTVNESIPATDAAKEVLRLMKEQWFYDKQATKIRELQERIKRLEAFLAEVSRRWECECHYAIQKECDCCRAEGMLKEAKP
jgi:hypothetical protein